MGELVLYDLQRGEMANRKARSVDPEALNAPFGTKASRLCPGSWISFFHAKSPLPCWVDAFLRALGRCSDSTIRRRGCGQLSKARKHACTHPPALLTSVSAARVSQDSHLTLHLTVHLTHPTSTAVHRLIILHRVTLSESIRSLLFPRPFRPINSSA